MPGGTGDLGEPFAGDVLEHAIGDERGQVRVAGAQVEVEEAVVVEVAEVAPHRGEDHVQPGLLGHVLEALARSGCETAGWNTGVCGWPIRPLTTSATESVVAGGEDVEPAVVVVVPGPAREALAGSVDAHGLGDVRERAVAIVADTAGRPRSGS